MVNFLVWLFSIILVVGLFWALISDYQQKQARSAEEYEQEVRDGRISSGAFLRAGLLEVEKVFKPALQEAVDFVKDEKQGETKEKEVDKDIDY
jgi:hypothetical protein